MKVVCTRVRDNGSGEWVQQSLWLTVGKEYVVLEIGFSASVEDKVYYRIIGDAHESKKNPSLFSSDQFVVVDGTMPKSWAVCQNENLYVYIGPTCWHAPGFWDDFYDGDPTAEQIYRREAMLIYEEAGYEVY